MITKDKKYTSRLGLPVTIYEIYENEIHGVIYCSDSLVLTCWTKEGLMSRIGEEGCNDLIEVPPYANFKIDDKVLVWSKGEEYDKLKGHYAGLSKDGTKPCIWDGRRTSFTEYSRVSFDNCELYKED